MDLKRTSINIWTMVSSLIRYNLKIIFAGKFIFFLAAALGIFVLVTVLTVVNTDSAVTQGYVYSLLLVPGLLLVFYPTAFGIQSDVDTRMIEILFGIPNYRYKVWLLRLGIIYLLVFAILFVLGLLSSLALTSIPVLRMSLQLMLPILFFGSIAFMLSTLLCNGSATAVVMIILGMGVWIAQSSIGHSKWNPLLNPFSLPQNVNEDVWAGIIMNNRVFLVAGIIAAVLYGLLNLQKRERFMA
jgi:hypothetical protein